MDDKDTEKKQNQPVLMTEEEYDARNRKKVRERLNRILRIIGLIALIFVMIPCIEPVFMGSVFGLWACGNNRDAWKSKCWNGNNILARLFFMGNTEDWANGGAAVVIPCIFYTLLFFALVAGTVYLLTYNAIDIILFFKELKMAGKGIFKDYSDNVKYISKEEGIDIDKKKEQREKEREEKKKEKEEHKEAVEKVEETKKDEKVDDSPIVGYTEEQLDALLRGEPLPPANNATSTDTTTSN